MRFAMVIRYWHPTIGTLDERMVVNAPGAWYWSLTR